ncbi:MFS transporter [Actinomadura fibrosa]|uniref:MFS transporter n=1 Tax=Actinomadura fibrosa TaxID=111802 RepID=A0ABW2Y1L3_9ACTN|nr:MFS transporter [Actinomadura fibrosa]
MHTSPAAPPSGGAGRREYLGLAVLSLPTLLLALDTSVLYMALPRLGSDLHAGSVQQLWITDVYGFMVAGLLITMGNLGDLIGRRRLLLTGAAAFGAASVLAAYSTSPGMLIAARAVLGIAGATLMPSTLTLISQMFKDPKQQAVAIGVWMGCFLGGVALGPVIGGVMLQFFWWGSVFLLGVPVMVLLLVTGPRTLPEYRDPDAGRIDPASVPLSLAGILPVVYGLKEVSRDGPRASSIAAIAAGLLFGALFVRRQRTLSSPLLDLGLFRDRTFSPAVTMTAFAGLLSGAQLFVYMYLQLVEGLSPIKAALWMLPMGLTTLVSLQIGPQLAQRIRPAYVMAGGLVIVSAGYLMLTRVGADHGLVLLEGGLVAIAAGIGPTAGLSATLALGSMPPERSGSAAAVNETAAELGIAMGVAVIGMVGMSAYRSGIGGTVPAGLPAKARDAALESAPGAAAAVREVGGRAGAELDTAAHGALAGALNSTAWVSVGVAGFLALVAITALRHEPPTGAERSEDASGDASGDADGADGRLDGPQTGSPEVQT